MKRDQTFLSLSHTLQWESSLKTVSPNERGQTILIRFDVSPKESRAQNFLFHHMDRCKSDFIDDWNRTDIKNNNHL